MTAIPQLPPPAAPYYSFLICSHASGKLVHVYFNGLPIGIFEQGKPFQPTKLNDRPIRLQDLADPCPFDTVAELKAALHAIVQGFSVEEPAPITS